MRIGEIAVGGIMEQRPGEKSSGHGKSVYSVAQVNAYIKNMFSSDYVLRRLQVQGEVSNCKYHSSGHIYFTLKDSGKTASGLSGWSAIACVMFAGNRGGLDFTMKDGQSVVVSGRVDVYERDGKYQIYAEKITLQGTGDLHQKFEQLKKELAETGMFDAMYKQPIPTYATRIGVVTAATGAAIQDILQISARRNPHVQIYLYPALVQGEGAAASVVKGIQTLDEMGLDCLIVGRGGGSIEDLWAFNEEVVVYAIFQAKTPIISAVGHQTDVTIADFVADMRAPTPSAAAELAVFSYDDFLGKREQRKRLLEQRMMRSLELERRRLREHALKLQLSHPAEQLKAQKKQQQELQRLLQDQMQRQLVISRERCDKIYDYLQRNMEQALYETKHRLAMSAQRLDLNSPLKRLSTGCVYAFDVGGQPLKYISQIQPEDVIKLRLIDGLAQAKILSCQEERSQHED